MFLLNAVRAESTCLRAWLKKMPFIFMHRLDRCSSPFSSMSVHPPLRYGIRLPKATTHITI